MTARTRRVLGIASLGALSALVFWSAHRGSSQAERRAPSAPRLDAPAQRAGAPTPAPVLADLPGPRAPSPAAPAPTPPQNEASLMADLRRFKDTDPAFAVERAREGNRRFPDSAEAPERASILIHALAAAGEASEARGEAEDMVNRYPDSEWVREVERFTGAHRHRNVSIDANGQLAYE